jgi:hypothetical protein
MTRSAAVVLAVLVFTDAGYVAYLNSFYAYAASIVFLLAAAAAIALVLADCGGSRIRAAAAVVAAVLFVLSKPQESVQAVPLALLFATLGRLLQRPAAPILTVGAAVLLAAGVVGVAAASSDVRRATAYNLVFFEMLPHSPDPRADLVALAVDPELARFAGRHFFDAEVIGHHAWIGAAFSDRVDHLDIARFYLARPERFAEVLQRRARAAFKLQPPGFGTFERSAGRPARDITHSWTHWSRLKAGLPARAATIFALASAVLAAAGWIARSRLDVALSLAALPLMAGLAFATAALDSLDHERHLATYNLLLDLGLVVSVAFVINALAGRLQVHRS